MATKKKPLKSFAVPIIHEVSGHIYVKARTPEEAIKMAHDLWEEKGFNVETIQGRCRETYIANDDDPAEVEEVEDD